MDNDSVTVSERSGAGLLLPGRSESSLAPATHGLLRRCLACMEQSAVAIGFNECGGGLPAIRAVGAAAAPRGLSCGPTGEVDYPMCRDGDPLLRGQYSGQGRPSATYASGSLGASAKGFAATARDPIATVGKEVGDRT